MNRLRYPANDMILGDAETHRNETTYTSKADYLYNWWITWALPGEWDRHNGLNFLFADGHAAWMTEPQFRANVYYSKRDF